MFGPHVNRDRTGDEKKGRPSIAAHIRVARAAAAEADFRVRAVQIFVAGPHTRTMTMRPGEADELKAYLADTRLVAIAHGTYMDFPWNGAPHSIRFIREELDMCSRAGISGLVIHLGKPGTEEVVKHLPRLAPNGSGAPVVFLEIPHVKPDNSLYETPEKLAALFRAVRAHDPDLCRFGLCIDTAHLWSCGVDLRTFESAEDWLRRLEAVAPVIPPDRIIIHLNDSKCDRGSGLDRHAGLFQGKIWGDFGDRPRQSGLAAFVDYIVRHDAVALLERGSSTDLLLDDYAMIERLTSAVRLDRADARTLSTKRPKNWRPSSPPRPYRPPQ